MNFGIVLFVEGSEQVERRVGYAVLAGEGKVLAERSRRQVDRQAQVAHRLGVVSLAEEEAGGRMDVGKIPFHVLHGRAPLFRLFGVLVPQLCTLDGVDLDSLLDDLARGGEEADGIVILFQVKFRVFGVVQSLLPLNHVEAEVGAMTVSGVFPQLVYLVDHLFIVLRFERSADGLEGLLPTNRQRQEYQK